MPFLDTIQNAALKVLPEKKHSLPTQASNAGISSGGVVPFEDDVSISVSTSHRDVLPPLSRPFCVPYRLIVRYMNGERRLRRACHASPRRTAVAR